MKGWVIKENSNSNSKTIGQDLFVESGQYALLARTNTVSGRTANYVYGSTATSGFPIINNSGGDILELWDGATGNLQDKVDFRTVAPNTGFAAIVQGKSMQLKSLDLDNSLPSSWCTSTTAWPESTSLDDYGTPGEANKC